MKKCLVVGVVFLTACSQQESFDATETARSIANENSAFNAVKWRSDSPFSDYKIITRGDSTQTRDCPQGDGWASIDLVNAANPQQVVKLKCSTYSATIGCRTSQDFNANPILAPQENKCNKEVPYPVPKVAK